MIICEESSVKRAIDARDEYVRFRQFLRISVCALKTTNTVKKMCQFIRIFFADKAAKGDNNYPLVMPDVCKSGQVGDPSPAKKKRIHNLSGLSCVSKIKHLTPI